MIERLPIAGSVGFEFGVAWGYGSVWCLSKIRDPKFRWDGFDRVTWHVGNLEDRIRDLDLGRNDDETWVVLFGLDVFEPSLVDWEYLKPSLHPSDLLYFDVAFDRGERYLPDHHILASGNFSLIGATPLALCLAVDSNITRDCTGTEFD